MGHFLLHKQSEVHLVADCTGLGKNAERPQLEHFSTWSEAAAYLESLGAPAEKLQVAKRWLDEKGSADLQF